MTKAKATKKSKRDYEKELVEGLIALMEEGTNPWEKDWRGVITATTATWSQAMSTQGPTQRCSSCKWQCEG